MVLIMEILWDYFLGTHWDKLMLKYLDLMKTSNWDYLVVKCLEIYLECIWNHTSN